ncbi:Spo0B domain-containing protein [Sporolactobacillus pectinivorans]|uniref:Spo0B domain-containing protein n=1 Tax=Sporolactobacillus pectinivorans TaxID=1591408 RepID=UPI00138FB187|nr:Spo0B domain-containing protein [Sporolactobacillus pectinivorans]
MINEEKGISMISSARHVLLNDIQLIKGYLYLNRPQKANEVLDRITEKFKNQSRISDLSIPECAFYLIVYDWSVHPFLLGLTVSGPEADLSEHDRYLTDFFHCFFAVLEEQVSEAAENQVQIIFENLGSAFHISVVFSGVLKDAGKARLQMNEFGLNQSVHWVEHYVTTDSPIGKMRWNLCLSIK